MVTHTRNSCSAFNPSIVHTHIVNTHPEQWAAIFMLRRPGSSWGFGALLKGTSHVQKIIYFLTVFSHSYIFL